MFWLLFSSQQMCSFVAIKGKYVFYFYASPVLTHVKNTLKHSQSIVHTNMLPVYDDATLIPTIKQLIGSWFWSSSEKATSIDIYGGFFLFLKH